MSVAPSSSPPSFPLVFSANPGSLPAEYVLAPSTGLAIEAVRVKLDGTGASGTFFPCLTVLSQDGKIIARVPVDNAWAVGDTGEVTWSPFLSTGGAGAALVATGVFQPAGGKTQITSTNFASPTTIVTSPSITADGQTTYRIDVAIALLDITITHTGTGASSNLTLYRGATSLGVIGNFNLYPDHIHYGAWPVYVSAFDTPPAGAHTYTFGGVLQTTGAATMTSYVYGTGIVVPSDTHPGYIAVSAIRTA